MTVQTIDTSKIDRFEVIDPSHSGVGSGRILTQRLAPDYEIMLSVQDDGRTLKVFFQPKRKNP